MKHTKKKRILAIVLCMILVLSTGIAAFANENVGLQSVACQAATLERVIKNAEGEDVGTLIADIPEGTFLASSSDANIQMDVQADVGADGVLSRVQQQLEANGETGYTLNNYVMADVTFYVNGEKQVPQQPITFTVKGTNLDSQKAVAFSDDRQNNPTILDVTEVTTEDGSNALQFTAETTSETVVYGLAEKEEVQTENQDDVENTENTEPEVIAYEQNYSDDQIDINATAGEGVVPETTDGLRLVDDIVNTGALKAEYSVQQGNESTITSYIWYRADKEDGAYTEVGKVNYQGGTSNLSEDGTELYPAFDNGARKWYKVKATLSNGTEVEAGPVQVVYYNELENGSFETPVVNGSSNNQWSNAYYAQNNGVWQTTGTYWGRDIEIVRQGASGGKSAYSWNGDWNHAAVDGNQFAKLNCEAAGALYQDVLTMEGTPLNYWLSHRARGKYQSANPEYDTMFLVIMPTRDAQALTTQEKLEEYLTKNLKVDCVATDTRVNDTIVYNNNGVLVVRITSNDQSWNNLSKTLAYTPTSSLTRFFFMSGKTASGNKTVGNFLDQVGFSQTLPPVADDQFSIQIEKKFSGLGNEDINKVKGAIQFEITATKDGRKLTESEVSELFGTNVISGNDMVQTADGTLVYPIANKRIGPNDSYQVTITEKNAEVDGYKLEASAQTKVSEGNGEPKITDEAVIAELKGKVTATVTFTNSYETANYKKVNFTKVWDDNGNSFGTRPSSSDVTLHASIVVEEDGKTVEKPLNDLTKTVRLTPDNTASDNDNIWKYSSYV